MFAGILSGIEITCYLILALLTTGFVACAGMLFKRTRSIPLVVALFMLYFWTFMGAWIFIGDHASGFMGYKWGVNYYYLMDKMFPFDVDRDYMFALLAYGLFCGSMLLPMMLYLRKADRKLPQFNIRHGSMLSLGLILLVISVLVIVPRISEALEQNISIYEAVRTHSGGMAKLHSISLLMASFCLVFGYTLHLARNGSGPPMVRWGYPTALIILGIVSAMIGDRHSIFTFFMLGLMFLLDGWGRKGVRMAVPLAAICILAILVGGYIRAFSWKEISTMTRKERTNFNEYHFHTPSIRHIPEHRGKIAALLNPVISNEMFAAHFSMYGILREEVPIQPAISLRYLVASLVPSFILEKRPPSAYDHYAEQAHLQPGQGYTIHHASAWFINGGWWGILLGGIILGSVLCGLLSLQLRPLHSAWGPILALLPFLFVAFLPSLIRSGPEAYRMMAIEALVIPSLLLWICCRKNGKPGSLEGTQSIKG